MELLKFTNVTSKNQFKQYLEYGLKNVPDLKEDFVMASKGSADISVNRFNTSPLYTIAGQII